MAFLPLDSGGSVDAEARTLRIASGQYGVFTHRQAVEAGMSSRTIVRRIQSGRWRRMHRGVYLLAAGPIGWEQRVMAACLACGPEAVASFGSAFLIWGFSERLGTPHITVSGGAVRRRSGVTIHRSIDMEFTTFKRFRVTTPMRTLLDQAVHVPEEALERALDDAHRRSLIDLERLDRYLADRERPGAARLRELLLMRDHKRAIGSDLETIFFRALRRAGLPIPIPQYEVRTRSGTRYIDFAYPDQVLALELDGLEGHGHRRTFDDDRVRQNELEELGWHFRRFTWTHVRSDPVGVAFTVGRALGLAPKRWTALSS